MRDKLPMPILVTILIGSTIFMLLLTAVRPSLKFEPSIAIQRAHRDHSAPEKRKQSTTEKASAKNYHPPGYPSINFRRRLAATISEVQRQIRRVSGKNTTVNDEWSLKLARVVEELDPRTSLLVKSSWDYSARLPDMDPSPNLSNRTHHVCPEVYLGTASKFGQTGMKTDNCSHVPAFSNVITAVLPATNWSSETTDFVIKQIRTFYDIPIIAVISSSDNIDINVTSLKIRKVNDNDIEATFLNDVVRQITTPYIFMATSLIHFNNQSSLERLVRVLDDLDGIKVAGGAARDQEGHWIHGCLQQKMANYQAHYTMGYYYSKYECMYCDDMITPFVTTKATLLEFQFTKGFYGTSLYRDWFAKVHVNGHLAMVCPDVMFYVSSHPTMSKDQWLKVAKQWSLEKITSYDNRQHSFSCDSVDINCKNPLGIIRSFLMPLCCKAVMEKYLSYLIDYAQEHSLDYELHAGSALGAMKMDGYLQWDYDMDIGFLCKDYHIWLKANTHLKPKGCHIRVNRANKYLTVHCPNFFLELYCQDYNATSQQYLPAEYQHLPTRINYSGRYVVVSANPGLYTRNKMGLDDLRHAAHWRTLKVSSVGKAKGGYEHPGSWNPCKNPKHHSCLDHYPGDGNLPFKEPFLNL